MKIIGAVCEFHALLGGRPEGPNDKY